MEGSRMIGDWTQPPTRLQRGNLHTGPYLSEHALLAQVSWYGHAAGYDLAPLLILDYWIALKVSPFVVLFGPSGLGKTELARLFAQALVDPFDDQYTYVDLAIGSELDSFNSLQDRFGWMKFLETLETAATHSNNGRVYFLCLDNLRLTDIETYFALLVQKPDEDVHRLALRGALPHNWPLVPPNVVLTGTLDTQPPLHFVESLVGRASGVYVQPQWLTAQSQLLQPTGGYAPIGLQRLVLQAPIRSDAAAADRLHELLGDIEAALHIPAAFQAIMWQTGLTYDQAWRSTTLRSVANSFALDGRGLFVPHDRTLNARFALTWSLGRQMMFRLWGHPEHILRLEQIVQQQLDTLPPIRWS